MGLIALGINHLSAPVAVREQVAFDTSRLDDALRHLRDEDGINEAAIVSTCNRTELYVHADDHASHRVDAWLHRYHGMDDGVLSQHFYEYHAGEAARHLFRVATGLDSMVLGEAQILGQVKQAYHSARHHCTLGPVLERLFQHGFAVAKRVRSNTAIGEQSVSVAAASVQLAKQIFANIAEQRVLLVGAGETIELVARHLLGQGVREMTVVNRSLERAQRLASLFDGKAATLEQLKDSLSQADMVVSSTGASLPVIAPEHVEHALRQGKRRPLFMVDLAVPRDIDAKVAQLSDVFLYTLDDLHRMIEAGMRHRRDAAEEADGIIEQEVGSYLGWLRGQQSLDLLRGWRDRGEQVRQRSLERARRALESGHDAADVLEHLSHTLTRRLLHEPSVAIREAAAQQRTDLLEAAREILDIPVDEDRHADKP